jgi:hypothetical protein
MTFGDLAKTLGGRAPSVVEYLGAASLPLAEVGGKFTSRDLARARGGGRKTVERIMEALLSAGVALRETRGQSGPKTQSVQVRLSEETYAAAHVEAQRLRLTMVQLLDKAWRIAAPEIRKSKP